MYLRYDNLTYESKSKTSHDQFLSMLKSSAYGISRIIEYGLLHVLFLIESFVSTIYTFYQKKMLILLIVVLFSLAIFYKFFVLNLQKEIAKNTKTYIEEMKIIESKILFNGIAFQYKESTAYSMIDLHKQYKDLVTDLYIMYSESHKYVSIAIEVSCAMILFFITNVPTLVSVMTAFIQMATSVKNTSSFLVELERYCIDYGIFESFWQKAEFGEPPKELPIKNKKIVIESVNIKRGTFTLSSKDKIELKVGERIFIHGPSGQGKSSFIKGLFGMLSDSKVKLSYGEGKNFYHTVSDYFQEIKEKLSTSSISISDIFKGEKDTKVIEKYLKLAWNENEYNIIMANICSANKDKYTDIHPFFLPIKDKLSGGQKSRMLLWSRGFVADGSKSLNLKERDIIVLDEPCPDVDHDTYIQTMNTFLDMYKNKMILFIGHLCKCKKESLPKIHLELYINKGTITQTKC